MATLKELADRTGFSPTTISRILTGDPTLNVSKETRARVLEEAGKLNYAATKSRRGRLPKQILRIGIAEARTHAQQLADPFYLYLRGFVERACADQRYATVSLQREDQAFILPQGASPIDGIIAIGRFTSQQVNALSKLNDNIVFLNSSPDESRYDSVVLNHALGITLALDYLLKLGHRKIGFVGPELHLNDQNQLAPEVRRQQFCRQMQATKLLNPSFLIETAMDAASAFQSVSQFLVGRQSLPTALLTVSEETALGTVRALMQSGLSLPQNMSLISFNDTPLSAFVTPSLTSISVHGNEMSRSALRLLTQRVPLPGHSPLRTLPLKAVVPPTLVVRDSTAAL